MEKATFNAHGLELSTCGVTSEELQSIPPSVRSNFNDFKRTAAAIGCYQRVLMEHAQPLQTMITRNRKKRLPTFMQGDTSEALWTESNLQ